MKLLVTIVFFALLLSGCGVQVVPRTSALSVLENDQETVTTTENGLTLSAKVQDLDFTPYTGDNNITSFFVKIANNSDREVEVPLASFTLFDQDRKLFRPLDTERVKALTRQEANYLVPYPFVGFYYLQDNIEFDYTTQSAQSLSYSPERIPFSVDSYALPVGTIPPGANISGLIFFNIDLYEKKNVDLTMQLPGEENLPATTISNIFDVVK